MSQEITKKISEEELEQLRNKIKVEFEGKNVSLNKLFLEYGNNDLVDVSVGEPDSPFDYGRWKDQLEKFRDIGASDIILVEASEGGYSDIVSLQTSTIRIIVSDPTVKSITRLMILVEDLNPDTIDYIDGYIEVFFG